MLSGVVSRSQPPICTEVMPRQCSARARDAASVRREHPSSWTVCSNQAPEIHNLSRALASSFHPPTAALSFFSSIHPFIPITAVRPFQSFLGGGSRREPTGAVVRERQPSHPLVLSLSPGLREATLYLYDYLESSHPPPHCTPTVPNSDRTLARDHASHAADVHTLDLRKERLVRAPARAHSDVSKRRARSNRREFPSLT